MKVFVANFKLGSEVVDLYEYMLIIIYFCFSYHNSSNNKINTNENYVFLNNINFQQFLDHLNPFLKGCVI